MAGLVRGNKGLIYPTGFTVASDTATVSIGNPYQIEYTITPSNATNQKIKWTSSNNSIATVDNKGIITAVTVGTCTVTGVYSYDGTTVTIAVTATNVSVTGIELDKSTMLVKEGKFGWLHATLSPSQPSDTRIVWTSSDTSIATVNEEGTVGYVSGGTATITATTVDGGYTATCVVSCMVNVKTFELDTHNVDIAPGATFQLNPVTTPSAAASEILLNWQSSDTSVATVSSSGLVTYVGYGECTITATTADGELEDTCLVYCGIRVTGVELDVTEGYLASGETLQLTETITPSDASNKNVTWSSSNTSVATVDSSGLVTYAGIGTTTITCTTEEGGYTATCTVVGVIPVTGVTLNISTGEVKNNAPLQLTATVTPSNATIKTVTWNSSDTSIATVSDEGLVTYVSDGTCTITCTTVQGGLTAYCDITCTSAAFVRFLLVGGGGGGSQYYGGGGGAGGLIQCSEYPLESGSYPIVIGSGGSGRGTCCDGINGGNSTALGFTAYGGGGGGGYSCRPGHNGGSGGGAGYIYTVGGTGCSGQGHNGGGCTGYGSGGGGGAGTAGCNGQHNCLGGYGGQGIQSDIDGTCKRYASGGTGHNGYGRTNYESEQSWCPALSGARSQSNATTCGGGGGGVPLNNSYGKGANGIFIISYPSTCGYNITGGTLKYLCNGNCIHCFTGNGTLIVS